MQAKHTKRMIALFLLGPAISLTADRDVLGVDQSVYAVTAEDGRPFIVLQDDRTIQFVGNTLSSDSYAQTEPVETVKFSNNLAY